MTKIADTLQQLFEKHRVVFWYDDGEAMRPEFEVLDLPDVQKIELINNAFGVKFQVLRQDQKRNFLIYHAGPEPKHQDNWLLDVQLANAVFSADRATLWLAELGLPPSFKDLVVEHEAFFQSGGRLAALKDRLISGDSQLQTRLKLMAVCLGSGVEARLESIVLALLEELAGERIEKYESLDKFGLLPHLWKELERSFGYQSSVPHIKDFAIKLFESAYQLSLHDKTPMNPEALIFLNRWKDSVQGQKSYELLARQFEKTLEIENKVSKRSVKDLLKVDIFKAIDHRILSSLMDKLLEQTLSPEACQEFVSQRKTTHWYKDEIASMYQAVEKAAGLLALIRNCRLQVGGFEDGFRKYTVEWFQIDQLYRRYIFHMRQSRQSTFFEQLNGLVEANYVNNFLIQVNNNWQVVIDQTQSWDNLQVKSQRDFFRDQVGTLLQNGAKAAVIISDALRYEVAEELSGRVEEAGRFTTELSAMAGLLPSYTALGMAALLPNETLFIQPDGNVLVDGTNSAGVDNRNKILSQAIKGGTKTLLANDLKAMTHDERRTLFRENQVVYVYHNQIDMVGDKRESEDQTVEAVETTLNDLVDLIKLLRSANFAKILVTSDHGFLYQYQKMDEADLSMTEITGKEIYLKKRRFAVGLGLENSGHKLKSFSAEQLGLSGDYEVLLAKSVNRLKLSGAGMQFVHGGSSLQEIVIPVLAVNMVRGEEFQARKVKVEKLGGGSDTITTGQLSVSLIQTEKISNKVLPNTLRIGIYAEDGPLISNSKPLYFGSESDNQRDWVVEVTLILSKDWQKYNRQTVHLRLEEPISNTDRFETVGNWPYYLNKTQFADF